jgi:hypothetical protein
MRHYKLPDNNSLQFQRGIAFFFVFALVMPDSSPNGLFEFSSHIFHAELPLPPFLFLSLSLSLSAIILKLYYLFIPTFYVAGAGGRNNGSAETGTNPGVT